MVPTTYGSLHTIERVRESERNAGTTGLEQPAWSSARRVSFEESPGLNDPKSIGEPSAMRSRSEFSMAKKFRSSSFSSVSSITSTGSFENINYHIRGEVEVPLPDCGSDLNSDGSVSESRKWFSFRLLWAFMGPGWLMSIAYLDPGNIESDLQAGAYTGYELLSVLLWSTLCGLLLQILAVRLGVVTGKHMAELCREEYPRPVSFAVWLMCEIAIVGSDIQEVIGSAIALEILFGFPLWVGCLVTGLDTFTFLGLHYFGVRRLEAFFGALILVMVVCFFANFAIVAPDSAEIIRNTVAPDMDSYALMPAVGLIGAVIMPHNIYLHSALVQTRKVDRDDPEHITLANKYFSLESAIALGTSFLINAAVVSVFAKGFYHEACAPNGQACVFLDAHQRLIDAEGVNDHHHHHHHLTSCISDMGNRGVCGTIGLADAGNALRQLLGGGAKLVWAIGLLAAGQSSTMTGTYAGQFVMQGFLELEVQPWMRVALTRAAALGPAVGVVLYGTRLAGSSGGHTTSDSEGAGEGALNVLDEWLNILQSLQLPFALLPLLQFTDNERIMGSFKNSRLVSRVGWGLTLLIMAVNIFLVLQQLGVFDAGGNGSGNGGAGTALAQWVKWPLWQILLSGVVIILYFGTLLNLAVIGQDIRRRDVGGTANPSLYSIVTARVSASSGGSDDRPSSVHSIAGGSSDSIILADEIAAGSGSGPSLPVQSTSRRPWPFAFSRVSVQPSRLY